jgi:drug/metabolite transporter (DMT)-like permease
LISSAAINVHQQNRPLGFASCALASALWGCGFFLGKIALAEMNVGAMVLYRFLFATIALIPLLAFDKSTRTRFNKADWTTLLLCAFLGIPLQFLVQFTGLSLTTVSHASLMVGTIPVMLAIAATLFAHERLDRTSWFALTVSTTGAALIALAAQSTAHTAANNPTLAGDLLVVLSLVIALGWILLNKRLMQRHSALTVTIYGVAAGTLMLALCVPPLYGLPPVHHISLRAWLALAASGLLCTASTTLLWNWGLTQVPASQAGVLLNMEPLIGSILGIALLHESLGPTALIGGILILASALLITTRSHT